MKTRPHHWLGLVLVVLLASGCAGKPGQPKAGKAARAADQDGPPLVVPPGLANLPDPEVRHERPTKRGNPKSYTVLGKTYHVMPSAAGYSAVGNASWYGRKFHGRLTSSGEPFDMYELTAAHRSLPIPTFARVTNLDNGRTTVVRINDRGPFHDNRIIDLSYAAAVKLGFAAVGTARVRVEVINPGKNYVLQAGAFSDLSRADRLKAQLTELTGKPSFIVRVSGETLYRVRLGPVRGRTEAERIRDLIQAADYAAPLILPY